jgi:hypothetical protein
MEPQQKKYHKELDEFLKKLFKKIKQRYLDNEDKIKSYGDALDKPVIESLLFDSESKKQLSQIIHRYMLAFSQQSGDDTITNYNLNIIYETQNTPIKTHSLKVSEFILSIIKDKVSEMILTSEDRLVALEKILELLPSEKWAVKETMRANILGMITAAKQGGLKFKTWWSGNDSELHKSLNRETVPIGENFSIGYQAPGMGEEDCNCFITFSWEEK